MDLKTLAAVSLSAAIGLLCPRTKQLEKENELIQNGDAPIN